MPEPVPASSDTSRPDSSASAPAVTLDALGTLLAFRDVQRKRTEYWNEYTDAIEAHLKWSAAKQERAKVASTSTTDQDTPSSSDAEATNGAATRRGQHSCAHAAGINTSNLESDNEQPTTEAQPQADVAPPPLPEVNGPMLLQIVNLVTQGLLSCSHQTRMLEGHLRDPAPPTEASSATDPQPDLALANLMGKAQDLENSLLRITVKRDQLRTGDLHSGADANLRDNQEEIEDLSRQRMRIRQEINEIMSEVQAEIAELQAARDE
ncbi:hypothetical protein OC861_000026 [Tilletia horrida]|nr:hypothetical protein OC861_000026 [Tilletia horrida]